VGFWGWLKDAIKKDIQRSVDRSERKRAKKRQYKEKYIKPSDIKYTEKDLIHMDAWLTDTKEFNTDGLNRQEVLSKCCVGDSLEFKLKQIEHDYYIIEVHCNQGCVGIINDIEMQIVARYIKNGGIIHNAKIEQLRHPKTSRGKIGCKVAFSRNKMR
jgi:hypothetical protein